MLLEERKVYSHARDCETGSDRDDGGEMLFEQAFCQEGEIHVPRSNLLLKGMGRVKSLATGWPTVRATAWPKRECSTTHWAASLF
jgi:hypothetical protein